MLVCTAVVVLALVLAKCEKVQPKPEMAKVLPQSKAEYTLK